MPATTMPATTGVPVGAPVGTPTRYMFPDGKFIPPPWYPRMPMTRLPGETFPKNLGEFSWRMVEHASGSMLRYLVVNLNGTTVVALPVAGTPGHSAPDENPHAGHAMKWGWNGDENSPTLTPSVRVRDSSPVELWHGFIVDGELRPC